MRNMKTSDAADANSWQVLISTFGKDASAAGYSRCPLYVSGDNGCHVHTNVPPNNVYHACPRPTTSCAKYTYGDGHYLNPTAMPTLTQPQSREVPALLLSFSYSLIVTATSDLCEYAKNLTVTFPGDFNPAIRDRADGYTTSPPPPQPAPLRPRDPLPGACSCDRHTQLSLLRPPAKAKARPPAQTPALDGVIGLLPLHVSEEDAKAAGSS
eukprot:gene27-25033_t